MSMNSSNNNKGLGRGLGVLFHENQPAQEFPPNEIANTFLIVPPEVLQPNPHQPRNRFPEESLKELADSIKAQGIIQPLLVRKTEQLGIYQIVAGERRWRAAQMAGVTQIPVLVRSIDEDACMIMALVENMQREDLNPMDQANALVSLQKTLGLTQEQLAEKTGQIRSTISNILRLVDLDKAAQDDLAEGRISISHAKAILSVSAPEAAEKLRTRILETGMSTRDAEDAASYWHTHEHFDWEPEEEGSQPTHTRPEGSKEFLRLKEQIGELMHCKAGIRGNIEKGSITLSWKNNEELFVLLEKLGLSLSSFTD